MAIVPFKLWEDMKRWKEEQIQKPRLPPDHNVSATASLQRDLSSYPGIQFRLPCTPPGQFFMGAKLFIGTPWMGNEGVLKKFWFVLCEIAWFLCQPIANLRRGVCL